MSLIEELGSRLRTAAAELPVGDLVATADRLRGAVERLAAIRHESSRGIGVAPLGAAVDHLEHALRALLVAQDDVAAYLAAIGLAGDAAVVAPPVSGDRRPAVTGSADATPEPVEPAEAMARWWPLRVDRLTGYEPEPAEPGQAGSGPAGAEPKPPDPPDGAAARDSAELLRRVVGHTDRAGLRAELRRVPASTGLGLAALTSTALRRIAAEILGHPPGPDDLPALRSAAGGRVRDLLPGLDPRLGEVLLARVCRTPGPRTDAAHPADSAVAGSVLTGALLNRAGRSPSTLDNYLNAAPEPAHA